jgi:hypothetical protein
MKSNRKINNQNAAGETADFQRYVFNKKGEYMPKNPFPRFLNILLDMSPSYGVACCVLSNDFSLYDKETGRDD